MADPLFISVKEASELTGLSPSYIYELAQRGEFPSVKVGGRVLVPYAALKEMASQSAIKPAA